jgi:hypothetical protein
MERRIDLRPVGVCGIVSGATAIFAWHQSVAGTLGGPTSLAQALWLNLTILVFLVMPLLWWRWSAVHPDLKILFAIGFAAFFLRILVEMPVLYLTAGWRCLYGIGHDLAVFLILAVGYVRCRRRLGRSDRLGEGFLGLYLVLLVAEAGFAWTFSQLASPAAGVYFAADTPRFAQLNLAIWWVVLAAYPLLGMVVWQWASARR